MSPLSRSPRLAASFIANSIGALATNTVIGPSVKSSVHSSWPTNGTNPRAWLFSQSAGSPRSAAISAATCSTRSNGSGLTCQRESMSQVVEQLRNECAVEQHADRDLLKRFPTQRRRSARPRNQRHLPMRPGVHAPNVTGPGRRHPESRTSARPPDVLAAGMAMKGSKVFVLLMGGPFSDPMEWALDRKGR